MTTESHLRREVERWRRRALSAERVLDQARIEIAESWRAERALRDHEQRMARGQRKGDL